MDGPWTQYQPASPPQDDQPAADGPWSAYAAKAAPAPTSADSGSRTTGKRLPMAEVDDGSAPPPATPLDQPRSGIGWRAKVAEGQAGQTQDGQSQLVADLNAPVQGLVAGVGQSIRGVGEKTEAFRRGDAEQRLDVVNRILSGRGMPSPPIGSTGNEPEFAMQSAYADMTPDQLRQAKAGLEARTKDAAPGQDTGKAVIDFAQKAFPVEKKNEGLTTEALSAAGSSVPLLAAGTAGGLVAGPAGAIAATGAAMFPQSYDSTFQDATAKGATPDQADAAATKSAAVQSGIMSLPFSRAVQMVPVPLRDGFVKTAMHLAGQGVEFSAANTASTLADNYVAGQTYDPTRPIMQGVAHAAEVGAVTGPLVGGAMAGAHGAVQHAVDIAAPIASPEYAAAQAKLRDLGGLPPLPNQSQSAAPTQPAPSADTESAKPPPAAPPPTDSPSPVLAPAREPAMAAARDPTAGTPAGSQSPQSATGDAQAPPETANSAPTPSDPSKPSATNPYVMVRPADLTLDPKRFQYKEADPDTGVTGALAGVKQWEPALADPIDAYRDTDGKLYVVNGHQRTDLATRAEAAGQPDIQIPARVYDAADGYTPDYMRALGAYRNIAQGSGTAIDAAKVMRATPPEGFTLPELPPRSSMVQQGQGLAKLSDEAFGAVVNNVVPAPYAAEIGRAISDPAQQMAAIGVLRQAEPANVEQARIMVQDVRDSGFLSGSQDDMFGSQAFAQSLFPERAGVLAQAMQNLRGNKRVFKAAVDGEDALNAAGNQMDTAANQQGQTDNERLIDTLQRSATTRGPLSDALSAAARDVAGGKQVRGASADFLAKARALVRNGQAEGVQPSVDPERAGPARAAGEDGSGGPAPDDVGPPQEGPGLFSARADAAPDTQGQRPAIDPARMQALAESVMRYTGTGKDVALKLVGSIDGGRADGSYANKLITFALDTKPSEVPGKLFHEIVHAMRDPALGLLKPGERDALDHAAVKYLKQGTNRADIVARYGDDASVIHEEAIARLAEQAHARAGSQPPFITRLADRMRNFVVGLGQALRGKGFATADDVFRSMMRGDRSGPDEHAALANALAARAPAVDSARPAGRAGVRDAQSIPEAAAQVQANTPDTYFARRDPKMADKEGLERAGQASMFGRNDAAVQAQAARDAAGGLRGKGEQRAADEGLFAPPQGDEGQKNLLVPPTVRHGQPAHDAAADVMQFGRSTGREKLTFYDPHSDKIIAENAGTVNQVKFTDEMTAAANDASNAIVAQHNHPGNRALSGQDLVQMARPGLVHVVAHGHDGEFSAASWPADRRLSQSAKGNSDPALVQAHRKFSTEYFRVERAVTAATSDMVKRGTLSMEEYQRYTHEVINRAMESRGLISYLSSHNLPAALAKELPAIIRKAGGDARVDGLTPTVRPDEGLARVVADARSLAQERRNGPRQPETGARDDRGSQSQPATERPTDPVAPRRPPDDAGGQGRLFSLRDGTDTNTDNPRDAQGRFPLPPGWKQTTIRPLRLPDAPLPEATKGVVREAYDSIRDMAMNGARQISKSIFPMRAGSKEAQTLAFKFANAQRGIQFRYRKLDTMIAAQFSPAERTAMGKALDAQSVFEQQLRENLKQLPPAEHAAHEQDARQTFDAGKQGVAGLTDKQRGTVEALNTLSQATWQRMAARGIVKPGADGLPYYMPRAFVMTDASGARRITSQDRKADLAGPRPDAGGPGGGGPSVNGFHQFGRNLTTSGPKAREYLTPEESTAAAKAKFGDGAELVTDIRSLVVALSRNERAIAGRDLVDAITRYGEAAHVQAVAEGHNPDDSQFFTLADHPSLSRWQPQLVKGQDGVWGPATAPDGSPVFVREPIHISHDFKGPLSAVLTSKSPFPYRAMMAVKSAGMHSIMFSPFMHLAVEIGRALPAMPGKVITGRVFVDGHRGLSDDAFMAQAIKDGLAPIAQSWSQDPASIADEQINPFGKNKVARAIGGAKDAVARNMERFAGEFAGSVIRDPHQALLWRNVLKLQVGIYKNARDSFMAKGLPAEAAGVAAAHVANRYAGALPPENLGRFYNMAANLVMFSRSFTLGNLGVMKDALNGAPSHVLAAVEAAGGDRATAQSLLARKARAAVIMDVGLHYVGTAMLQGMASVAFKYGALGLTGAVASAYSDWQQKAWASLQNSFENPLEAFGVFPQHFNEPNKQDRAFVGTDARGTGQYARVMFGKVGEEMLGWTFHPGTMIANKENPLLSGSIDVVRNEDSMGRKIYPADANTIGDWLRTAGLVVEHLGQTFLPMQAINDVRDMASGIHAKESAAQLAGQMVGVVQMSSGFPGGPQAGVEHAAKDRSDYEWQNTMPAAHRLAEAGNLPAAEALIQRANLSDRDKAQMMARLGAAPPSGPSRKQAKEFARSALPSEQAAVANVTQ